MLKLLFCVFLLELFYASFCIEDLLAAREEGMTFRADIDPYRVPGRTGIEALAACADDLALFIIGMYVLFQLSAS